MKRKKEQGRQGKREKRGEEKAGRESRRMVYNLFPSLVQDPVPGLQRISKATC